MPAAGEPTWRRAGRRHGQRHDVAYVGETQDAQISRRPTSTARARQENGSRTSSCAAAGLTRSTTGDAPGAEIRAGHAHIEASPRAHHFDHLTHSHLCADEGSGFGSVGTLRRPARRAPQAPSHQQRRSSSINPTLGYNDSGLGRPGRHAEGCVREIAEIRQRQLTDDVAIQQGEVLRIGIEPFKAPARERLRDGAAGARLRWSRPLKPPARGQGFYWGAACHSHLRLAKGKTWPRAPGLRRPCTAHGEPRPACRHVKARSSRAACGRPCPGCPPRSQRVRRPRRRACSAARASPSRLSPRTCSTRGTPPRGIPLRSR